MANELNLKTPWLKSYGSIPFHLEYPDCSMVEMVEQCAEEYPDLIAYEFMGKKVPYKTLVQEIDLTARSLAALGIRQSDGALNGLWIVYALVPVIGMIISTFFYLGYKLNDKDVQIMAKCNSGEITREQAQAQLSRKY